MTDDVPSITGWKPPVIYDIQTDQMRIATQDDIDRLTSIVRAFGIVVSTVEDQRQLLRTAEATRQAAGV